MSILLNPYIGGGGFTPIGNASAISPDWKHSALTLSNGNLTVTHDGTTATHSYGSIDAKTTGKWYYEVTVDNITLGVTEAFFIGIGDWTVKLTSQLWANGNNVGMDGDGLIWVMTAGVGSDVPGPGALSNGDIISVSYDADTREVRFRRNGGAWYGPFTLPGANKGFPMGTLYRSADAVTYNFGGTAFAYALPSGYLAWSEIDAGDLQGATWRVQKWAGSGATSIAELELRLTSGGADQTGGGTASAGSTFGTLVAANAIDNNTSTIWGSSSSAEWWQVILGSEMAIRQLALTCRSDSAQHHGTAAVVYSRDGGTSFFPARAWNGLTWTNGETKVFDLFS